MYISTFVILSNYFIPRTFPTHLFFEGLEFSFNWHSDNLSDLSVELYIFIWLLRFNYLTAKLYSCRQIHFYLCCMSVIMLPWFEKVLVFQFTIFNNVPSTYRVDVSFTVNSFLLFLFMLTLIRLLLLD